MSNLKSYSKENLRELNVLQAVKIRPGMYIGSLDTNGFINFIDWLLLDLKPFGNVPVDVCIKSYENNIFKISIKEAVLDSVLEFLLPPRIGDTWTSGYNYGLSVLMGLSSHSSIKIRQSDVSHRITSAGIKYDIKTTKEKNSTISLKSKFQLDQDIFKNMIWHPQLVREAFTEIAYLMPQFRISLIDLDPTIKTKEVFYFPDGISEKLTLEIEKQTTTKACFIFDKKIILENYKYHIAFCILDNWTAKTYIKTFTDTNHLYLGGSLEDGIIKGMKEAINQSVSTEVKISTKKLKERLILLAQVKGDNFRFEGSLKAALDMPILEKEISEYIRKELLTVLKNNSKFINELIEE